MEQQLNKGLNKGQRKAKRRQKIYAAIAIFLALGLVLSTMLGFANIFMRGKTTDNPYLLEKEREAAVLEEALAEDPENVDLATELGDFYFELAKECWQHKDYEERGNHYARLSQGFYLQALDSGEDTKELILKIAIITASLNEFTLAEEYYQRALSLNEEDSEVLLSYGLFLYNIEQKEEAISTWEKVLENAPEGSTEAEYALFYLALTSEKYADVDLYPQPEFNQEDDPGHDHEHDHELDNPWREETETEGTDADGIGAEEAETSE